MSQVIINSQDLEIAILALRYTARELLNTTPVDPTNDWAERAGADRAAIADRLAAALRLKEEVS